jgi:CRP-like cAMP-binding protein
MENRFIAKLRSMAELNEAELRALAKATAKPRKVPAKRDLIREGDRPGPVFVMLEGWACKYKVMPSGTRQILAFMMPGDSCDLHVGLLGEMDHSIQTITPSIVAKIEEAEVVALMDHPGVAKAMYTNQLVDEGILRAWITSMGRRTSRERVAHLMCELYLRARNVGLTDRESVTLPLSQVLLADSLGMTAVHLNRVVKELRELGAMDLQRGKLIIKDALKIVNAAGFDENYLHRHLRVRPEFLQRQTGTPSSLDLL